MTRSPASTSVITDLSDALGEQVVTPDDDRFERARTIFYGGFDRRPAAVVRPRGADEVARVVSAAQASGLELAVRSGGHSNAGHGVCEGGIVLDLSEMKALEIDVAGRTAWADAGVTAGEYTAAAGAHGLATGFGDTGSVGLGGLTLGGGVGFLSRAYGLTIDHLLAAEVVTADGQVLHVDAETDPDLFWAIRGGGGNFGVATRFRFRLNEVPEVVGGLLMLPATADLIASFVAEAQSAPESLTTIANIMPAPPMPFIPAEQHGSLVLLGLMCHAGDADSGQRALEPFRALATPIVDMVGPKSYPEIFFPDEEDYHPLAAGRTMFLDHVDRSVAQMILDHLAGASATMAVAQLRVLGGAVARVPSDATAYAHRASPIMANVAALYEQPGEAEAMSRWVGAFAASLRQDDHGAYVNFLADEGPERVRAAYPGTTWDRLRQVKARYDPTNLFSLNQNVPPSRS